MRGMPLFALLLAIAMPAMAQHANEDASRPAPPRAMATPGQSDPHAGHAMPHMPAQQDTSALALPAPTSEEQPAASSDPDGMRMQDHMDDDPVLSTVLFERFERQYGGDTTATAWELQGWVGDLENRLWLRSEGERRAGAAHGDLELLWGRPAGPWWDVLAGVRHEFGDGPDRDWVAVGVQGLAPYKFEVSATAYLGSNGRTALRALVAYELLLTNRLILQPRIEAQAHGKDDARRGIGSGLSDATAGLRMRYELHRRFAPYLGLEWRRSFGRTRDMAHDATAGGMDRRWVAGVRFWF